MEPDVLIIGGGAQGLWLLNELTRREYRALLLERSLLGGGQTCHSHALIHRGHYYDDVEMMVVLNAAAQMWHGLLARNGLQPLNQTPALAGFGPGTSVSLHRYFWDTAGLRYRQVASLPNVLRGGKVEHLFETDEFSVDASHVVTALADPVLNAVYKVDDDDDAVTLERTDNRVVQVVARISGASYRFKPRMVVLAAGESNLALLRQINLHHNPQGAGLVQARRKNHMLVLRGPGLEPMTAVFPIRGGLHGVFLCSRRDPQTGEVVWLASDHNSTPFDAGLTVEKPSGETDPTPVDAWLERMLVSLSHTSPGAFHSSIVDGLEYSVYTGLTSERDFGGVGKHMTDCFIDPLGMENLLAIWPTKLTLTPFASNIAARFIRARLPHPQGTWSHVLGGLPSVKPQVAPEMWTRSAFTAATSAKTDWRPLSDLLLAQARSM